MENRWTKNLINGTLILAMIFLWTKVSYVFQSFLDVLGMLLYPIIISFFFYYLLRPITRKLSQGRMEKYKGLISALVIIVSILLLLILISRAGVVLKNQFEEVFFDGGNIAEYKLRIYNILSSFNLDGEVLKKLSKTGDRLIRGIGERTLNIWSGLPDLTTQILLIPFVVFYLLRDEKKSVKYLEGLIPRAEKDRYVNLGIKIDRVVSDYIINQLVVALIIGGLMLLGYLIVGVPYALLMASFATVTSIIPVIGSFLGVLPALLMALTIDLKLLVKIIIVAIVVQQMEGNLITPMLMSNKLAIHPLWVMIIVIVSLYLMGIFGAFIGIPVYLVSVIIIKDVYNHRRDKGKYGE